MKVSLPYQIGDLILVNFPYQEDLSKSKPRPGLVVDIRIDQAKGQILVVNYITSVVSKKDDPGFLELLPPPLKKVSYISLDRSHCFRPIEILDRYGSLNPFQLEIFRLAIKNRHHQQS
jgi:hypothetical protein